MNMVRALCFAVLLALPLSAGAAQPMQTAGADMTYMSRKPVMVIRFNQRTVRFERQLYSALEQIVRIKEDVLFDVVAVAPEITSSTSDPATARDTAARNGQRVVDSMVRMGVPRSRISFAQLSDPTVRYSEVRLYAR